MKYSPLLALIGSVGILSGCSMLGDFGDTVSTAFDDTVDVLTPSTNKASCEERTTRLLENTSFEYAAPIEMVVRHGEFSPMIIRMSVGRSYVMRIRNRDTELRSFNAPEFFDSIAIAAAALDNDILATRCPGPTISLRPGQSFEMKLLAVVDGRFEYRDTSGSILNIGEFLNAAPSGGIIRIEERY